MENIQIEQLLKAAFPTGKITVEGDGRHFDVIVIAEEFAELSKLKRQQMVYAILKEYITSGDIHAVNMKTLTLKEWERTHG